MRQWWGRERLAKKHPFFYSLFSSSVVSFVVTASAPRGAWLASPRGGLTRRTVRRHDIPHVACEMTSLQTLRTERTPQHPPPGLFSLRPTTDRQPGPPTPGAFTETKHFLLDVLLSVSCSVRLVTSCPALFLPRPRLFFISLIYHPRRGRGRGEPYLATPRTLPAIKPRDRFPWATTS